MTICYQKLDLGWPDILNDAVLTIEYCKQKCNNTRLELPLTVLCSEFVDYIRLSNLEIYKIFMFHTDLLHNSHRIHIDDNMPGDFAKLNWVYGDNDADMIWYQLKSDCSYTEMAGNNGYIHYTADPQDVIEICRCRIDANPTIVRTGILHTAVNHSGRDRFVVQLWLTNNGQSCTFNELVDTFQRYCI